MKILQIIWATLLLAAFAMWFGGFGFYASIVVPAGNEILGSYEQATVTRKVTVAMNAFAAIMVVAMVLDNGFYWKSRSRLLNVNQLAWPVVMAVCLGVLLWLHPRIEAQVNWKAGHVGEDYDQFYFLHRCYLWTITVQWIAAWFWLFGYAATTFRKNPQT